MNRFPYWFVLTIAFAMQWQCIAAEVPTLTPEKSIDFQKQIQPILAKKCYACHGPDEAESGLRLDNREGAFAEAESGEFAIVAGNLDESVLYHRITTEDEFERMPPEGDAVTEEESKLIAAWIRQGATWKDHWAFEPLRQVTPPRIEAQDWDSNPIDAFVFERLRKNNLAPNGPADKQDLLRRVHYDLTGLPPSKEEIDRFVEDESSDAFEKVVERLLGSVHYGERWGSHWLDLVRFAETNSFERDGAKQNAWKFRDYVIRSFNEDKPYDQFIREQLAGDELDSVTVESLTATGFYRLGIWDDEPADPLQARYDQLDDLILTTGQVFLGLTMNCARCHDHKIDPIPQANYYGMLAFFEDVTPFAVRGDILRNNQIDISNQDLKDRYRDNDLKRIEIENAIREMEQLGIAKMSGADQRATEGSKRDRNQVLKEKLKDNLEPEQWRQYNALKKDLTGNKKALGELPKRDQVMGLGGYRKVSDSTFVLYRGSPHSPSDPVEAHFPSIFKEPPPEIPEGNASTDQSSGRRRILAEWIANEENRLTARVMVNRIWQFHFGRGIVRSSNNFGMLGTPPTHPDLLDFLANRFMEDGWSIKAMHRLILSSRTYQMSSQGNAQALEIDPENNLFWRFDPRRLSAEEVRDSILAAAGTLNRKAFGPSIYPALSAEVLAGQSRPGSGWGKSSPEEQNRRSVYIYVKRSLLTPILSAFDFPDPDQTCEARFMTLQPAQALSLLNGSFAAEQSSQLTERLSREYESDEAFVDAVIHATLGRESNAVELADGVRLIETLQKQHGISRQRARELYSLSVLNWNEFLFLD